MRKNIKLLIEYDGTDFLGWQRQKHGVTVQGELENKLSLILNKPIKIHGSGRTDAGVHAYGQVANFICDTKLEPENIKRGLNSLIKLPIVVRACHEVDLTFHAQYKAVSKTYHYHILNRADPAAVGRNYLWHISTPLDTAKMNRCCRHLIGERDFKSFENQGSPRSSTIRIVHEAKFVLKDSDHIRFNICASGFLKNMVRNIVGTLVQVGLDKMDESEFVSILDACDRTVAGPKAPAGGLFLHHVDYMDR